jgi:hypothetical protein
MAFEGLDQVIYWIIEFAIILFPTVYLVNEIKERIEIKTTTKKVMAVFLMSLLISMAVYPFILGLVEYTAALEVAWEENALYVEDPGVSLILFNSDYATYAIMLLLIFLIYLVIFNKTKR